MPPCLLETESAEAAAECSGSECWNHWWSCWSSNFCTCSGHLIVVYKLTPVGSCSNNRFCSEKQNNSTPNRKAAIMLILTGAATLNLCQVQGQVPVCGMERWQHQCGETLSNLMFLS